MFTASNINLLLAPMAHRFIQIVQHQRMKTMDGLNSDRHTRFNEMAQLVKGSGVIGGFEMFTQAVATNGDALFNDHLRFSQAQSIALDGVAVIGQADAQILMQAARNSRGKRAMQVEAGLLLF